jgi:RNA polymerase sigma-70 factor (ECF subfamily)
VKRRSPLPKEIISQLQDDDLVQRARQGDQRALVEIYETCQPSVFAYIFYRVCDQDIAEDLTSEVFTRMLTSLSRYQFRGKPILAWLFTIARNLVFDHFRQSMKSRQQPLQDGLVDGETNHPVNVTENRLTQECLHRAMKGLTEEQRQVILLKFIENREVSELAKLLGKNERAIRSLQHRALATLQRLMKKERCNEI